LADAGTVHEMIVVLPDAHTLNDSSMYSNSPTTGNWESYIPHDLVAYINSHYCTMADRDSRGLAGHSMGGYDRLQQADIEQMAIIEACFVYITATRPDKLPNRAEQGYFLSTDVQFIHTIYGAAELAPTGIGNRKRCASELDSQMMPAADDRNSGWRTPA
jgi:hypothetical protein